MRDRRNLAQAAQKSTLSTLAPSRQQELNSSVNDADDELLEDGRTDPPPGDTVVADHMATDRAGFAALAVGAGGRIHTDGDLGLQLTDTGSPTGYGNIGHLSRPLRMDEVEHFADVARDFFAGTAGGPWLLFSAYPSPDLHRIGLRLGGHPPLMVRSPAPAPAQVSDLRIVRVEDPAELEVMERTLVDAYPIPELQPFGAGPRCLAAPIASDDRVDLFVGYAGDEAVATAARFIASELSVVALVSTRPECRGRGYGRDITAACLAEPDRPTTLVTSDDGRRVYAGLDFLSVVRQDLWIGTR
jgi:hypothetical protein